MDYNASTIAQLKAEIDARLRAESEDNTLPILPYNSKTKKADLIDFLSTWDSEREAERKRADKMRLDGMAQRKAFRAAPVVRKSNTERRLQYIIQRGTDKLTARQARAIRKADKRDKALLAKRMGDWA